MNQPVLFMQPYGLKSSGGGARILRSLLNGRETDVVSVCTDTTTPPSANGFHEVHVPFRPFLGRIETTRLAGICGFFDWFFRSRFARLLEQAIREAKPSVVHVIPHAGLDFDAARIVCRRLHLPLAISIHDHPSYCFRNQPWHAARVALVGQAWRESACRFVISDQMGLEMERLFGAATWELASDGLDRLPEWPPLLRPRRLHLYFMGLFHNSYRRNLECLLDALVILQTEIPDLDIRIKMRCGPFVPPRRPELAAVEVLPFADEDTVADDMKAADMLYLPLPFGDEHNEFVRYSLSTKLISYLGSSRPILFHGPRDSAASRLLEAHNAALMLGSLDPRDGTSTLKNALASVHQMAETNKRAHQLAKERFMADGVRARFWNILDQTKIHR